jgi:hypothetical protein
MTIEANDQARVTWESKPPIFLNESAELLTKIIEEGERI